MLQRFTYLKHVIAAILLEIDLDVEFAFDKWTLWPNSHCLKCFEEAYLNYYAYLTLSIFVHYSTKYLWK